MATSSAKSKSFNTLAGYRLQWRGCVTTPESRSAVAFFMKSTKIPNRNGAKTSLYRSIIVETSKGSEMFPSTITALSELL